MSKSKLSRVIARLLLVAGFMTCLFTLTLSTVNFLQVKNDFVKFFEDSTHYALIIQLVILFVTAGVLASGDAKEKDWMKRNL